MRQKAIPAGRQGFAPILLVLMVAVFGGLGYWAFKSGIIKISPSQEIQEKPVGNTTFPTVVPSTTDTPAINTSNWKAYENSDYHFTLKYPASWVVEKEDLIQNEKTASFCVAGGVKLLDKETNLNLVIYYRYPGLCRNTSMRTGVGYNSISDKKTLTISGVTVPYVYYGIPNLENPKVLEVMYNQSVFIKVGSLEFLFETVQSKEKEISEQTIAKINSILETIYVPSVNKPLEIESVLSTAFNYCQMLAGLSNNSGYYSSKDENLWDKIKNGCVDKNTDWEVVDGFKIVQSGMINSRKDVNTNTYHTYFEIWTAPDGLDGKWRNYKNVELIVTKVNDAWKVLNCDFSGQLSEDKATEIF